MIPIGIFVYAIDVRQFVAALQHVTVGPCQIQARIEITARVGRRGGRRTFEIQMKVRTIRPPGGIHPPDQVAGLHRLTDCAHQDLSQMPVDRLISVAAIGMAQPHEQSIRVVIHSAKVSHDPISAGEYGGTGRARKIKPLMGWQPGPVGKRAGGKQAAEVEVIRPRDTIDWPAQAERFQIPRLRRFRIRLALAKTAIRTICEGLTANFPEHQKAFEAGRDAYLAKLDRKIAEWQEMAKPLQGLKFISYHNEWAYFNRRYGLVYVGTIELRHGVEPTARHIADLMTLMKTEHCRVVVREPQFSERVPSQIAAETGAALVKLPIMVGGVPQAASYFDLIEYNLKTLLGAAKQAATEAAR